jgi:hypothetical protein
MVSAIASSSALSGLHGTLSGTGSIASRIAAAVRVIGILTGYGGGPPPPPPAPTTPDAGGAPGYRLRVRNLKLTRETWARRPWRMP